MSGKCLIPRHGPNPIWQPEATPNAAVAARWLHGSPSIREWIQSDVSVSRRSGRLTKALRVTDRTNWSPAPQGPLQRGDELLKAGTKRLAKLSKLDYVKTTFAPLALANECLCLSDFLSKLSLCQAGSTPGAAQDSEEYSVMS